MSWLLTTIHVIFSLILILMVLLQSGKGAEMGAVFGGSSQTVFGSRGAASFLSKITAWCAVGFFCTSLTLVVINATASRDSIMQQKSPAPTSEATTAPAPSEQATPSDVAEQTKSVQAKPGKKAEASSKSAPAKVKKNKTPPVTPGAKKSSDAATPAPTK